MNRGTKRNIQKCRSSDKASSFGTVIIIWQSFHASCARPNIAVGCGGDYSVMALEAGLGALGCD